MAPAAGEWYEEMLGLALADLGAVVRPGTGRGAPDLVVELPDGDHVRVDVKVRSRPTSSELEQAAGQWRVPRGRALIVVGDELPRGGVDALWRAGISSLDRRGRLRLRVPGLIVDRELEARPAPARNRPTRPVRGEAGISTALVALLSPDDPPGVRATARMSGLSPTAISDARAQLREAALLDRHYRPLVPELFWEVVAAWRPERREVPGFGANEWAPADAVYEIGRAGPFVDDLAGLRQLVEEDRSENAELDGWAQTGTMAAATYGAEVVVGRGATQEFLVPVTAWERVATRAEHRQRNVVVVEPAPSRLATRLRRRSHTGLPLAHPLVVAIELGRDEGRGREILATFRPEGVPRVWR